MKNITKIALALLIVLVGCGTVSSVSFYDYASQVIRTEFDGSYVIRACGKGDNSAAAMVGAQKVAVYDVVFNGVASASTRIQPLKPLLLEVNAKTKYQDYFNAFFADGGEYTKYFSIANKRAASSDFKRSRQQVQCVTTVTVDVAGLKQRLMVDNIIKR